MTRDPTWRRVAELFDAAVERPPGEREQWLRARPGVEPAVRAQVEHLLRADGQTGGLLDHGMAELASDVLAAAGDDQLTTGRLAPGRQVGPYRLLREAGHGGMGVVYQAFDPRLRRFVALKFLDDPGLGDQLFAEARAAAALDHPRVCTVYDVGQTPEGHWYIAMAYYAGQTLAQRLVHGALPVREAIEVGRQVLEALAAAHARAIVHRDVKPSNVMLAGGHQVKLLDFGIASLRRRDPLGRWSARLGTPAYMAPERFGGQPADHLADLWAVGVLLHEMVSGSPPFEGQTLAELTEAVTSGEPAPLGDGCPGPVKAVIRRALSRVPTDRYPDAHAFVTALDAALAATRDEARVTIGLPAPATTFLGRGGEVATIVGLLEHARLVTLTGPGGAGKTRLSIEVARRSTAQCPDGVHFIPLEAARDSALVPHLVAQHLGLAVNTTRSVVEVVASALQGLRVLLVLDNFEQVRAAAPFVTELLQRCDRLRVLVTSRAALHVRGEQECPVAPLPVPPPTSEASTGELLANPAVALFVARAQAVRPAFRLTRENASGVLELCRCLDGLPLAIELAAARINLLTPQTMLSRLGRQLELLRDGPRDAPARHQTLSAAVAWSYELLPPDAQRLFRRLGSLTGSGSLGAVEAVAAAGPDGLADALGALAALVDHSLVRQEESATEPRFAMLQTIRTYAVAKLDAADPVEAGAARGALARHLLTLAEEAEPELTGRDQARWFDRLEAERGNWRAAVEWAIAAGEIDLAARLAAAVWRLWLVRGPLREGRDLLERVVGLPASSGPSAVQARVLAGVGTLAHNQGDNQRARERLQESLALWRTIGDRRGMASALTDLAWVHCELSELEPARRLSTEALALHRASGDRRGAARALNNLGWVANYQADYRRAREYHEAGLAIRRAIGDERGIAFALSSLAWAEMDRGDPERASARLAEATEILERVNDPVLLTFTLLQRARLARRLGDHEQARRRLDEVLRRALHCGNASLVAWSHTEAGHLAIGHGELDTAAEALETALRTWRSIGCGWGVAVALVPSAELAAARHDPQAEALIDEAIDLFTRVGDPRGLGDAWETLARMLTRRDPPRARELLRRAERARAEAHLPREA